MAKSKKSITVKASQPLFKELIVPGNLFSKEYGVIIIEVTKGTQSFYYVANILRDATSAFNPLFVRFGLHLTHVRDSRYVFLNRLMVALKMKTEEKMFSWLQDATIKFLFYKTDEYDADADYSKSQSIHREKIRNADSIASMLLKEISSKYKRNQILNYQNVELRKHKPVTDIMVNQMIERLGK